MAGHLTRRVDYGLYVHIPLCAHRCAYCTFVSTTELGRAGEVVAATAAELRGLGRGRPLATVYLGGGTPSLLPPPLLEQLMGCIRTSFRLLPGAEVTLEANPEDVTPEALAMWRTAGVTRLSLGVQSVDDRVLSLLERRHDAATARQAVGLACAAGFTVAVDLMLGLPGASVEAVLTGVAAVAALGPHHLSLYLLETDKPHRLGAWLRQRPQACPGEEEVARQYLSASRLLRRLGYQHYEVSNFARPGFRCRHNLRTWRQRPLLAAGVAACGHCGRVRWGNLSELALYLGAVAQHRRPLGWRQVLTREEWEQERAMLALRLRAGASCASLAPLLRRLPAFAERLEDFLQAGLARRRQGRVYLTPRGWLLSSELLQWLW